MIKNLMILSPKIWCFIMLYCDPLILGFGARRFVLSLRMSLGLSLDLCLLARGRSMSDQRVVGILLGPPGLQTSAGCICFVLGFHRTPV